MEFGGFSPKLHDFPAAQLPSNVYVRIRELAIRMDQGVVGRVVGWQLSVIDRNAFCRDDDQIGLASNRSCTADVVH